LNWTRTLAGVLAGTALAMAQGGQFTPQPGRTRSVDSVIVPLNSPFNALQNRHEWGFHKQNLLTIMNSYTLVQSDRVLDNFFADLRGPGLEFTLGSQFLSDSIPVYQRFAMRGFKVAANSGPWSGAAWAGTTQNWYAELKGTRERHLLAGATLGYTPSDFRSVGVTVMPYASSPSGGLDRAVAMAQFYLAGESEQGQSYAFDLGYGRDFGAPASSSFSDRQGLKLRANYLDDRLKVSLRTVAMGKDFGPPQGAFDLRGRHTSNLSLRYKLSPRLTFLEQAAVYEQGLGTARRSRAGSMNHSLRYQADQFSVQGGLQQLGQSTQGVSRSVNSWNLQGTIRAGDWEINPQVRVTQSDQGQARELGIGVSVPITDRLRLTAREFYDTNSRTDGGTFRTNVGLNYEIPRRGEVFVGYTRDDSLAAQFFQGQASRDALTVSGSFKLRGDLQISASTTRNFSLARLDWLPDDHNKVTLEHRRQDPSSLLLLADQSAYPIGNYTTLSWTTSWGGPIEAQISRARLGQVVAKVSARPPGDGHYEAVPVPRVRVSLNGIEQRTNAEGEAHFSGVKAGSYELKVARESLQPPYELVGEEVRSVEVPAGEIVDVEYGATAFGQLEVIAFNDEGNGLTPTYVPVPGLKFFGPDGGVSASGSDGKIVYSSLLPGPYTVKIDPSHLPAGYTASTMEQTVELGVGDLKQLEFGLQGQGKLRILARSLKLGSLNESEPLADLPILLDKKPVGLSSATGALELTVTAGGHALSVHPTALAGIRYVEGPERIVVEVNQEVEVPLLVARFGLIRAQVVGARESDQMALTLKDRDGVEQLTYLDAAGEFSFGQLKVGRYQLTLEPNTVAEDLVLAGPATQTLEVTSGQHLHAKFYLVPKGVKK